MIYLLDRNERIKQLPDLISAKHTESLNRESVLDAVAANRVEKYEHLVYQDASNRWHEFIVSGIDEVHTPDGVRYHIFAESVLTELIGDWISDRRIVNQSVSVALTRALENTRWQIGTVTVAGNGTVNFYRESAYSALGKIAKVWDAEIRPRIVVTDGRITARYVDVLAEIGQDTGSRFEWNHNILEVRREILRQDVITALHGYGRGEEIGDGYGRRINFASINAGLDYVTNEDARRKYGRVSTVKSWEALSDEYPTWADVAASGLTWQQVYDSLPYSREHRHGKVEFDELTDPAAIKNATLEILEKVSKPQASYTASVVTLTEFGLPQVNLGDSVVVIDDDLEIESKLRVVEIERDLLDPLSDRVTLGQLGADFARTQALNRTTVDALRTEYGVSRMVSEDGRSWFDYSVPEIVLDSDIGKLRIAPDVIFQLMDAYGRMVAGFTEIDGRKGLMVPFLGNTIDGSYGYGSIGAGTYGGAGFQFNWQDFIFMFSMFVGGGMGLYVDNHLRQSWTADGSTYIRGLNNTMRLELNPDGAFAIRDEEGHGKIQRYANGAMVFRDKTNNRLDLQASGATHIRDQTNTLRLEIATNGNTRIYDHDGNTRARFDGDGSNYIFNATGNATLYQDGSQTRLGAPVTNGGYLYLDANQVSANGLGRTRDLLKITQAGRLNVGAVTNNVKKSVTLTFPTSFGSTNWSVSFVEEHADPGVVDVSISSITASGCVVNVMSYVDIPTLYLRWTAVEHQ